MPSHEELLIKSSGTGSLLLYYGYPLRRPCIRHWPTVINCSRRTNLAEATLDLHTYSQYGGSKRNRCIVHVWRERRFQLLCVKFIVLYSVLLLCEYWKRFGKGFLRSKYLEGFFFFLYFLSIERIERKIYFML